MQAKVTNPELRQALTEFFQKRFNVPVKVVAIDFKGIRSEEGYHANVDLHFDGIDYQAEALPKVISHEQSPEPEEKQSKPKDIFSMYPEIQEILQLMEDNPNHSRTQEIIEKVHNSNEEVVNYFENYPLYVALVESYAENAETDSELIDEENFEVPKGQLTKGEQADAPAAKYDIFGNPL